MSPNQIDNLKVEKCEVCGGTPPPGHRICDECWPTEAIKVGRAGVCQQCGKIRLSEKLVTRPDGKLVCQNH